MRRRACASDVQISVYWVQTCRLASGRLLGARSPRMRVNSDGGSRPALLRIARRVGSDCGRSPCACVPGSGRRQRAPRACGRCRKLLFWQPRPRSRTASTSNANTSV